MYVDIIFSCKTTHFGKHLWVCPSGWLIHSCLDAKLDALATYVATQWCWDTKHAYLTHSYTYSSNKNSICQLLKSTESNRCMCIGVLQIEQKLEYLYSYSNEEPHLILKGINGSSSRVINYSTLIRIMCILTRVWIVKFLRLEHRVAIECDITFKLYHEVIPTLTQQGQLHFLERFWFYVFYYSIVHTLQYIINITVFPPLILPCKINYILIKALPWGKKHEECRQDASKTTGWSRVFY